MLFNFQLAPLEHVQPFGSGSDLSLHWFGLTDGCYWLRVGEDELFRYRETLLAAHKPSHYYCEPYVDYQVVRLWEDILDILPDVLAPVPAVLADRLLAPNLRAGRARIERWLDIAESNLWEPAYEHATEWLRKRHLVSGHLMASPIIWLWSDGTQIHIEWDNRERMIEDMPAWTAQIGSWVLPVEAFLQEVRSFDSRLMQAMQARVEAVTANWARPDVRLDIAGLIAEHADRSMWLDRSLSKAQQKQTEDWETILDAIALIEAETPI